MKITSPVSSIEEVTALINAGASELYCGLISNCSDNADCQFDNRRSAKSANFNSFEDLKLAIDLAHKNKASIYITLNSNYFSFQEQSIINFVENVSNIDIDGFIVSNISTALFIKEQKLNKKIIMGTGGTCFNNETIKFYKDMGIDKITLPRHLTIEEIKELSFSANEENMPISIFILYEPCRNIDGFCSLHAPNNDKVSLKIDSNIKIEHLDFPFEGPGCRILDYPNEIYHNNTVQKMPFDKKELGYRFDDYICGACALYDLKNIPIYSLKIAGRGRSAKEKIEGTSFIRNVLDLLENNSLSKQEFVYEVQSLYYDKIKPIKCSGYNCYYPSTFHGL